VVLPSTAPISTVLPLTAPYWPMLLHDDRYGPENPGSPLLYPVLWSSMQVKRRAETAVVGRLTHGVGRVSKDLWGALARRAATGVTSAEEGFGLVPVGSARCLIGVNLRQLPPCRDCRTQACECVHTWTFVLLAARLNLCGVSGAYSCLCCCKSGGYPFFPSLLYCDQLAYSVMYP